MEKEDKFSKGIHIPQQYPLTIFRERLTILTRDIDVRGLDNDAARIRVDNFIQQLHAVNNISEVIEQIGAFILDWRTDPHLLTTDILSPILYLLEEITDETMAEAIGYYQTHLEDILSYLNKNPIYSQSSDGAVSQEVIIASQSESHSFQYDPSRGATQFMASLPVMPLYNVTPLESSTNNQIQQSPISNQSQPYNSSYDVSSQDNSTHNGNNLGTILPDAQPLDEILLYNFTQQSINDTQETQVEVYDDNHNQTDNEQSTQATQNYHCKIEYNDLPKDILYPNHLSKINDKKNIELGTIDLGLHNILPIISLISFLTMESLSSYTIDIIN